MFLGNTSRAEVLEEGCEFWDFVNLGPSCQLFILRLI